MRRKNEIRLTICCRDLSQFVSSPGIHFLAKKNWPDCSPVGQSETQKPSCAPHSCGTATRNMGLCAKRAQNTHTHTHKHTDRMRGALRSSNRDCPYVTLPPSTPPDLLYTSADDFRLLLFHSPVTRVSLASFGLDATKRMRPPLNESFFRKCSTWVRVG